MKRSFTLSDSIQNFFRRRPFPRRQSRQQRGSIMLLTAVAMIGLLGLMALAIDLGYLFSSQTQLQNGINVAALAAGAGLRVTIEADPKAAAQENIAISLATKYGGLNEPRILKLSKPDKDPKDDAQSITANMSVKIDVDPTTNIPSVRVGTNIRTPTLFAGAFGLQTVKIGTEATASLLPVDGGTGTIASGSKGARAGCWRPLLLPDTFYNRTSNTLYRVSVNSLTSRRPTEPDDYYRSRFAAGDRNVFPFVDSVANAPGSQVTGLSDTQLEFDIGAKTIMGQQVTFGQNYYYIANFSESGLPQDQSLYPLSSVSDVTRYGYCGKIQVGAIIKVYDLNDLARYDQVKMELRKMREDFGDSIDSDSERIYHYVTSGGYPDPNSHPLIIPGLLYNPIIQRSQTFAETQTQLAVTNIGLFYLKDVSPEGDLTGYFVREIIAGGTQILPRDLERESASFQRRWLPMSVQLIPNKSK